MKLAAAKGSLTLVVLGKNPLNVAFTELSSFGSFEINQNYFTWPSFLQAYICLKHLFFKSKELCLLLFLFLLPCSPDLLSLSYLLHIHFPFLLPWLPSKCKIERTAHEALGQEALFSPAHSAGNGQ